MTHPCECPVNATPVMAASWYKPEETKARVHVPNQCPGDYNVQKYRRGVMELWLCSACWFTEDELIEEEVEVGS